MKCIICYKEADCIFQATTYCKEHFEKIWAFLCGDTIKGKNINQMKIEFDKNKIEVK